MNVFSRIKKDSFLSAFLQRYSSTLVVQLSGFVVGMVVSKILGPEMLGLWGIFQIITQYYAFTNLGATNGLTRNLGFALGAKDNSMITKTVGAANLLQATIPGAVSVIAIIISFFLDFPYNWIVLFSGLFGFVHMYEEFVKRILTAFEKHKKIAWIAVVRSLASIVIIIPLVYYFDIQGRVIAALLLTSVVLYISYKHLPVKLSLVYDKKEIISLISVGAAIAMAGFLGANFFLVDRLVVTKFLTLEQLGLYVFAFYLVKVIKSVKQTVTNILYQRQNIIYGEDGPQNLNRIFSTTKNAAFFATDLTSFLSGIILIVFTLAVKLWMPEYELAIPITFVVVFSQAIGQINVFNTVGKHYMYLSIMAISLIVNILFSILFVHYWGLIGVAFATLFSFMLLNLIISFFNLRYFKVSANEIALNLLRIGAVPAYFFMVSYFVIYFLIAKHYTGVLLTDIKLFAFLLFIYLILSTPMYFLLKRSMRFLNEIALIKTNQN